MPRSVLSLCSGIGGLDLAVEERFDAELVAFSENDKTAASIMERHWPGVSNIGDLKVADWAALGHVDIICGGIPCQPWSTAGKLGRTEDDRHLWPYVADAVRVLRPGIVIVEEVAGFLANGGLGDVLADLCALGFNAEWAVVRASDVGAPHRRERCFLLAWHPECARADSLAETGRPWRAVDRLGVDARELKLLPRPSAEESTPTEEFVDEMIEADVSGDERLYLPGRKWHSQRTLSRIAPALLPTPIAHDAKGAAGAGFSSASSLQRVTQWGGFSPAIERWGEVLGREAPDPLIRRQLSPDFVEWMMGYDEGWTAGLPRTQRLKCLGNAVVTRQAQLALQLLGVRACDA